MEDHKDMLYPVALENKRVEISDTIEIKTSPDKVFPLACPVEELRWIPNWKYQLIYSKSGINEPNCIFSENMSGPIIFGKPVTTTWATTLYDPSKYSVHFLLTMADNAIIKWEFLARETGINTSTCTWTLVFTAIDEETNQLDEKDISKSLTSILSFLSGSLKYYCENGEMIKM